MKVTQQTDAQDRGSGSLELAMLASLLLVGVLLVSYGWRVTQASGDVSDAAAEAARAASQASFAEISGAAQAAAEASLSSGGLLCQSLLVSASRQSLGESEAVDVSVTCTLNLGDLALVGVPGQQSVTQRHVAVFDRFRGGS